MASLVRSKFKKEIFFIQYNKQALMLYILHDCDKELFAVVISVFLYDDESCDHTDVESTFLNLVTDELTLPFMEWFSSIDEAIIQHLKDFQD